MCELERQWQKNRSGRRNHSKLKPIDVWSSKYVQLSRHPLTHHIMINEITLLGQFYSLHYWPLKEVIRKVSTIKKKHIFSTCVEKRKSIKWKFFILLSFFKIFHTKILKLSHHDGSLLHELHHAPQKNMIDQCHLT